MSGDEFKTTITASERSGTFCVLKWAAALTGSYIYFYLHIFIRRILFRGKTQAKSVRISQNNATHVACCYTRRHLDHSVISTTSIQESHYQRATFRSVFLFSLGQQFFYSGPSSLYLCNEPHHDGFQPCSLSGQKMKRS
jgi:hypothetical protein